jgi:uncharacterized protein
VRRAASPSGTLVVVVHACTLTVDIRIPSSHSLKEKRGVVRHLVEGARSRFGVAASETGHQDQWQRCELGYAAVAGSHGQVTAVLESVERYVWATPDVEVVSITWTWTEADD